MVVTIHRKVYGFDSGTIAVPLPADVARLLKLRKNSTVEIQIGSLFRADEVIIRKKRETPK